MWEIRRARLLAVAVAFPPIVTLVGELTGTGLTGYNIVRDVGQSVEARGALADVLSHSAWVSLLAVTRLGSELLAALAICSYLRSGGENLWSFLAVPLLTLGHAAFMIHEGWGLQLAPAIAAGVAEGGNEAR